MSNTEVLLQQLIIGLSNGMIIALIALGYTMVYGIVELINFAHGDLFMLGAFLALTVVGALGLDAIPEPALLSWGFIPLLIIVPLFCATLNWSIDRLAYRPLRDAPRLAPLVSAIGVSFVLINIGLFWGGLRMDVFNGGVAAASPKDFPWIVSSANLLGPDSNIILTWNELLVFAITVPLMIGLSVLVKFTRLGKAMRAVAQNPTAARLMGIDVDRVIGATFLIGGALAGAAAVGYSSYNHTIYFQMGFRVGMDAFTAAVLGGIGNLPGALVGGLVIGVIRAMSDQYIATEWTNVVVFAILIVVLTFRPSGILGATVREKV
ncbi:MAG TPA: branched-chain amino acid ABC transporter permease [Candidatus Hydrogenedentes bacterium]|nr:branched-chain amino acid ABC transporter permease [Candidatus Hydrogenedentota bacterium]